MVCCSRCPMLDKVPYMSPRRSAKGSLIVIASFAAVFGCAACGSGSAAKSACVRVSQSLPGGTTAGAGKAVRVSVGDVVWVVLVEAELPNTRTEIYPQSFPWKVARSSDISVLRAVRLCPQTGASSLANEVYGFRAEKPGGAEISAPLVTAWRRTNAVAVYRAHVTVQK